MTLGQKQRLFTRLVALFILECYRRGYELSFGEATRSNEQAEINAMGRSGRARLIDFLRPVFPELSRTLEDNVGSGIRNSLHEQRLAIDFNLFKEGRYLQLTPEWQEMGEYWESLHPLARWGGRFGDGNHISLEHEGRK